MEESVCLYVLVFDGWWDHPRSLSICFSFLLLAKICNYTSLPAVSYWVIHHSLYHSAGGPYGRILFLYLLTYTLPFFSSLWLCRRTTEMIDKLRNNKFISKLDFWPLISLVLQNTHLETWRTIVCTHLKFQHRWVPDHVKIVLASTTSYVYLNATLFEEHFPSKLKIIFKTSLLNIASSLRLEMCLKRVEIYNWTRSVK